VPDKQLVALWPTHKVSRQQFLSARSAEESLLRNLLRWPPESPDWEVSSIYFNIQPFHLSFKFVSFGGYTGKPGGGATAGGVGGGNVGPGGTNIGALSNANAQEGIAFGEAVGVGIDLPLLGVHQAFGQGGGIAVGK
jgi:hypothetical protein